MNRTERLRAWMRKLSTARDCAASVSAGALADGHIDVARKYALEFRRFRFLLGAAIRRLEVK